MTEVMQRAFAAGEVSPVMYSRADMLPYGMGLRTARNFIGKLEGGMMKRPGSQFIRAAKVNGTKSFAFIFNEAQTYHLEMGYDAAQLAGDGTADPSGYIRFTSDKSTLVLPAGADGIIVTAWAQPVVYVIGNLVSLGVRHYYCKAAHTSAALTAPNLAGGKPYWYLLSVNPDVTNGSIFEIPIPYGSNVNPLTSAVYGIEDIWSAYPVQSADVMIFTNSRGATSTLPLSAYAPHQLRRHNHLYWDFVPINFRPNINGPGGIACSGTVGAYVHRYKVTAIKKIDGVESVPGYAGSGIAGTLTSTGAADAVIASAAHGLTTGEEITILTLVAVPLNEILEAILIRFVGPVTVTGVNTFSLDDTDGLPVTAATHTLTWQKTVASFSGVAPSALSDTNYMTVNWAAVVGASLYCVYKEESDGSGAYGFMGNGYYNAVTGFLTFRDIGTPPDMSESPPRFINQFMRDGRKPAICGFFDQRLALANSEDEPQTIWLSRSGDLFNFSKRFPLQDDDAITAPLASKRVNEVRHVRELSDLLVLTRGSEGLLQGAADEAVTPTSVRYKPQGYHGSSNVQPLEIADRILYGLARGNKIQEVHRSDLGGYEQGIDPAIYSSHLFGAACGCAIVAMDWAERPDDVVWIVRSDGVMLMMTFMPDQNVRCWTWGETHGLHPHHFKDVVVVPEGSTDTPYVTVSREMDGVNGRLADGTSTTATLGAEIEYIEAIVPRCPGCSSE